jgi:hypothetical protein
MNINISNTKNGVKATLTGFSATELGAKIEACQTGNCDCNCDPAVMEKITGIDLKEENGGTTLTVTGDVDAQTLAPMMQSCLIGESK